MVTSAFGNKGTFEVRIDLHQGSALSHFHFVLVMETLNEPWELLCANNLIIHNWKAKVYLTYGASENWRFEDEGSEN